MLGLGSLVAGLILASIRSPARRRSLREPLFGLVGLLSVGGSALAGQGPRRLITVPLAWEKAAWLAGGDESELFVRPNRIAVHGSQVIITDPGAPAVVALDAQTGKLLWRHEKRGSGPGELRQPVLSAGHPRGVVIADNQNRRLLLLSRAGRVMAEMTVPGGVFVAGLCGLSDGRVVLHFPDPVGSGLAVVDFDKKTVGQVPPALDTTGTSLTERALDIVGTLAAPASGCLAARKVADGLAVFGPTGRVSTGTFVERLKQRRIVSPMATQDTSQLPIPFSLGVSVDGRSAYVHFGGATTCAYLCVDVYELPSLRYRHTLQLKGKLGIRLSTVTVAGGKIVLLGETKAGSPIVLSFTLPPEISR